MGDEKKVKLSCGVCDATYYAENVDFPVGTSAGSIIPPFFLFRLTSPDPLIPFI
jgi:hypothetical protein